MAITKEDIHKACSDELIASRDCHAIAAKVSEGRVRNSKREIGNGTIIDVLQDLTVANALLEVLHTDARFKYVVPLLEQGRLIIGAAIVRNAINSFVPAILTPDQAAELIAIGLEPDPVSSDEVFAALFNDDGSLK